MIGNESFDRNTSSIRSPWFEDCGRQLLPESSWSNRFVDSINSFAQSRNIELIHKTTPSVVYSLGGELSKAQSRKKIFSEATNTESMIDIVIEKGLLDPEIAISALSVAVDYLHLKPLGFIEEKQTLIGRFDLRAILDDNEIWNERTEFQHVIGTTRKRRLNPNQQKPGLLLGTISCKVDRKLPLNKQKPISNQELYGLYKIIGKNLVVKPLGPIIAFT